MYASLSELRQRVIIERPITEEDAAGNISETGRERVAETWAKVLPYAAKIADGYSESVNEISYRVILRYREDIEVTDILLWEEKVLQISAPPYGMDGLKRWLVLECKELVENG